MKQVAAYCRVSTEGADQANSFLGQQRYFQDCIQRNPEWTLWQVYADEGITGTTVRSRAAFLQMMEDARAGRFDMILTKEVSRFSRNILDTLQYTRELKRLGIGVLFVQDGIWSLDPDAELRLSIMGSIAQEESRRTSERVKWGQRRRMEQGVVFGGSLLGYQVRRGQLIVEPRGAEIVRWIFHQYLVCGKGGAVIARELREAGLPSGRGRVGWTSQTVRKILKNEKYCGDLVQGKSRTTDYLTHARAYGCRQDQTVIRNHHEAIIERSVWEAAQQEMRRRCAGGTAQGRPHPLSGKLYCGRCGSRMVARQKERGLWWRCGKATAQGAVERVESGRRLGCALGRQLSDEAALELVRRCWSSLNVDPLGLQNRLFHVLEAAIGERASAYAEQLRMLTTPDHAPASLLGRLVQRMVLHEDGHVSVVLKGMEDAPWSG